MIGERIGLVIGQLSWGGAERQASILARGLAARGESVTVICLSQVLTPFGDELQREGIDLRFMERRGRRELSRVLTLARLLRRERPALVHSFLENASIYSWLAGHMARGMRFLPSVRCVPTPGDPLRQALLRRALLAAPLIISNSRAVAQDYSQRYRVPPEKFRVVLNGVAIPEATRPGEQARCRSAFRLSESNPVLGTVSKSIPQKNVPAYLRLVERLGREFGPLCSMAAGAGLDESYAARLPQHQRRSVCQTVFLGPLNGMDSFYRSLDILVLTSFRESLPNVLLEAMSYGVPCVAYAVAGIPEVIEHGVDGLLVPPDDEEALFQAARSLLEDPERRQAMGQAARSHVTERFSVAAMVEGTCRVYQELLKS
ncbi:glycosyltransferase [bacterium]|nr:glycosyltransferase [bacterium]